MLDMTHNAVYLTQVFSYFLWLALYMVAVWGFFWILRMLVAPLIRDILRGVRIR